MLVFNEFFGQWHDRDEFIELIFWLKALEYAVGEIVRNELDDLQICQRVVVDFLLEFFVESHHIWLNMTKNLIYNLVV